MTQAPGKRRLDEALAILRSGGVVAFPTETFFGLGVDAQNEDALNRLNQLKGRNQNHPFPLLLPSRESIRLWTDDVPIYAEKLMNRFWPGPLTLVLPSSKFPVCLRGSSGGVGFRLSAHPVANQLVKSFEKCITATSANRSKEPPGTTVEQVEKQFESESLFFLDTQPTTGGLPSTVLDCTQKDGPHLIRAGLVSLLEIQSFLKESHHG